MQINAVHSGTNRSLRESYKPERQRLTTGVFMLLNARFIEIN